MKSSFYVVVHLALSLATRFDGSWDQAAGAAEHAPAATAPVGSASSDLANETRRLLSRGLQFLKTQQQPDGGWQRAAEPPAITALVAKAFAQDSQTGPAADFVKQGYDKLLSYQLESGGIYRDALANYNTAIAVSALAAAKNPAYQPRIEKAMAYLKGLQWTEQIAQGPKGERDVNEKHRWYGGWGYGGQSRGGGRPDLSNAQTTLDALHDAGLKPDDPAYQAALVFVTRLQNNSETNDSSWAANDGGFIYGPSADGSGESFGGEYTGADGRRLLRSYGSMTYAGLKSMIYAGLKKDDPRVRAAWAWITKNWTLDENPGMRGGDPANAHYALYYYYLTLARALRAYGEPVIVDASGTAHDWRVELVQKLGQLQRADGSWVGEKRWMEDNPVLVTAYVSLALEEVEADLRDRPPR